MAKGKEKEYDLSAFDKAVGVDFSAFDKAVKKKVDSQSGGLASSSGFAPSQDIKVPTPVLGSQYAPMPAEQRYKAKTPVAKDIALMDNFVGYMVDKVVKGGVKGAVSVPNFAGDLVATITSKLTGSPMVYSGYTLAGPSFLPVGDEKWKNDIIQGRDIEQKEGIDKLGVLSSKKYEEGLNKSAEAKGIFSPQFVGSSLGSLAESVGMGLTTGGAGFYTSIIEDSYLDAKKKGLSDVEAFAYGSTVGAVNGALEKYGMDALLKGMPKSVKDKVSKYVTNKVLSKLTKSGVELTEDIIEKTIAQEVKGLYQIGLKVGAKGIYNATTEGSTELGQEISTYTAEKVVNTLKGKEIFKQQDTPMRFAQAFFGGAFGGSAIGSVAASFGKGESYNYIKQKIAETKNDDAKYDMFRQDIADDLVNSGVDEGKITQALTSIDAMREKQKSIPDTVPAEAIDAITELQETRDNLQAQIEEINAQKVDPAFAKSNEVKVATLQGSIDATNDAIASKSGDKILYRQTEKGFEREIDGKVEPITQQQFDYADANNLEGIEIEHDISDQKEGEKPKKSPTSISSVKIKAGVEFTDKQKADLKELEDKGWTKSKGEDGSTIYTKPKEEVKVEDGNKVIAYHAGTLDSDGNIYLTEDSDIANEYSGISGNEVQQFEIDKSKLASEENARDIIASLELKDKNGEEIEDGLLLHEILDDRFDTSISVEDKNRVFEELKKNGFEGITFIDEDITQKNKAGVESILVFEKPKAVKKSIKEAPTEEVVSEQTGAVELTEAQQNELADIESQLADQDISDEERQVLEERKSAIVTAPQNAKQDTKAQIEKFGVAKEDIEPVLGVVSQLFNGLKKAGLTAAKTVGDWVNISKGKEKPYALKINGKEVQVKSLSPEVVNGFYSPLEKTIGETKFDKLPAKQWIEKFAKGEEAKWTGLNEWLSKQEGSVSKSDIQQYLKDNRIQVVEVVKGEPIGGIKKASDLPDTFIAEGFEFSRFEGQWVRNREGGSVGEFITDERALKHYNDEIGYASGNESSLTKFSQYQTEGEKTNYKEVLVTMPVVSESAKNVSERYWEAAKARDEYKKQNAPRKQGEDIVAYIDRANSELKNDAKYQELTKNAEVLNKKMDDANKNQGEKFKSSHFDEPNILVHLRMNTRTDADGKKVLFIEEVQSDWGQQGKKRGFKKPENTQAIKELENEKQKVLDSSKSYQLLNSKTDGDLTKEVFDAIQQVATNMIDNEYSTEQSRKERFLKDIESTINYWSGADYQTPKMTQSELSDFYDVYIEELKNNSNKKTGYGTSYLIADIENKIQDINTKIFDLSEKPGPPTAPFVTDTNSWAKLGLKVALKEAIKQGADKIAWTTGEQQNERYDLSNTLKTIDITRLDSDGNRFVYIKAKNDSDGSYKVDSNGKVLSSANNNLTGNVDGKNLEDVIGKELTSKVLNANDGDRLSGEDFKVGGKGMKGFYGSPKEGTLGIIGNVAKSLFKQEPKTVDIKTKVYKIESKINDDEHLDALAEKYNTTYGDILDASEDIGRLKKIGLTDMEISELVQSEEPMRTQHSIDITPELKASVEEGQPLFKKGDAQYRIESGKNIIEAIKNFNGSPKATIAIVHEIMHPTVVSIIDAAKEGNEIGVKHTQTIVDEYNKANPKNTISVEDLISGNDAFKGGETNDKYRAVQEFIAKSWEKYHTEGGQGFSEAFQKVLEQITKAFQSVYKSLKGKQLTPELRDMFDELLGKEVTADPKKVISEAVSLYGDIMEAEGGAKKRTLSDKRRALLDANPRAKHIFENMNKIQEALGERITKEGNCP